MSHDVQTAENEEKHSPLFYCFEGWAQGGKKDFGKGERERGSADRVGVQQN